MPRQVSASHILVKTEQEAQALRARIAAGEDFGEIAKKHSTCPSGRNCGDLGWFRKGQMVPEFEKAAFALKKGQMSEVVKTSFGYHIIMCDDVDAGGQIAMADARNDIERQIRNTKGEETVKALIEQAKKATPVTINEGYFQSTEPEMPIPGAGMPQVVPAPPSETDGAK